MNSLTFSCGQIIFKQGEFADVMYDIVSGKVGVYADYGKDGEKLIAELGSNQVLGELGMLEYYPRSATAVALEDGTVLEEINDDEFQDYFRNKPEKLLEIMKQLSKRIRDTDQKLVDACRAVYENDEAEKSGAGKSEWLEQQVNTMCEEYAKISK